MVTFGIRIAVGTSNRQTTGYAIEKTLPLTDLRTRRLVFCLRFIWFWNYLDGSDFSQRTFLPDL
jgi:hypothetical protein